MGTDSNPEKLSKNPNPKASEALLGASMDQVRVRSLAEKPARSWPKKSLIKGRKNALATVGLKLDEADPEYRECVQLADNYRKHRARELVIVYGFVSAGVSSLLASSALALAASRYLYERAGKEGDVSLLMQASKLADSSRQNELAAWELCQRESVARKKAEAQQEQAPWIRDTKPGRPKATEKARDEVPVRVKDELAGYTQLSNQQTDISAKAAGAHVNGHPGESAGSISAATIAAEERRIREQAEQFVNGVPVRPVGTKETGSGS